MGILPVCTARPSSALASVSGACAAAALVGSIKRDSIRLSLCQSFSIHRKHATTFTNIQHIRTSTPKSTWTRGPAVPPAAAHTTLTHTHTLTLTHATTHTHHTHQSTPQTHINTHSTHTHTHTTHTHTPTSHTLTHTPTPTTHTHTPHHTTHTTQHHTHYTHTHTPTLAHTNTHTHTHTHQLTKAHTHTHHTHTLLPTTGGGILSTLQWLMSIIERCSHDIFIIGDKQ